MVKRSKVGKEQPNRLRDVAHFLKSASVANKINAKVYCI